MGRLKLGTERRSWRQRPGRGEESDESDAELSTATVTEFFCACWRWCVLACGWAAVVVALAVRASSWSGGWYSKLKRVLGGSTRLNGKAGSGEVKNDGY